MDRFAILRNQFAQYDEQFSRIICSRNLVCNRRLSLTAFLETGSLDIIDKRDYTGLVYIFRFILCAGSIGGRPGEDSSFSPA